jgi:hypothetical protein
LLLFLLASPLLLERPSPSDEKPPSETRLEDVIVSTQSIVLSFTIAMPIVGAMMPPHLAKMSATPVRPRAYLKLPATRKKRRC